MDGAIDTLGSAADFDFFIGDWNIRNLRLKERFAGSDDWEIFPATSSVRKILEGTGNFEEMHMPSQGFTGMTLRLFNPRDGSWSLHWADSRSNVLFPPVIGHFDNGKGVFYGEDMDEARRCAYASCGPPRPKHRSGRRRFRRMAAKPGKPTG